MIEIKNISKSFNGRQVLYDISGTFEKGQTTLVIGSSGTGKSVLLKCMLDLIRPEEGEVLYDGRKFLGDETDAKKEVRREMGVLFQGNALFDSKTVHQNVRFPLDMLTTMAESEKEDRVQFCLDRVGLGDTGKRMPSEISGGMKKRVGIARAIVMNPKYLFCDEPNSGLDPLTAIKIDELIKEITNEYDITTVVITHDMNSVLTIGQKIMFLYQGKKIWEGNSETIMQAKLKEIDEFVFSNEALRQLRDRGL
ncbi:phospholipid/cholesterol/gamma-HCH transport system ATP-binding protein [Spirosomataceae bacterium TFI 002]|nr:phospholipid/cholesterol/gamma-HCH transport system ATP-binding protein [Spirosomataceae bacterium TFI 002]